MCGVGRGRRGKVLALCSPAGLTKWTNSNVTIRSLAPYSMGCWSRCPSRRWAHSCCCLWAWCGSRADSWWVQGTGACRQMRHLDAVRGWQWNYRLSCWRWTQNTPVLRTLGPIRDRSNISVRAPLAASEEHYLYPAVPRPSMLQVMRQYRAVSRRFQPHGGTLNPDGCPVSVMHLLCRRRHLAAHGPAPSPNASRPSTAHPRWFGRCSLSRAPAPTAPACRWMSRSASSGRLHRSSGKSRGRTNTS